MKQLTLKQCVVIIRVAALALLLVIISLFLFSFSVERRLAEDMWKQLGIDKVAGTNNIKESFYHNYLYLYGAKNAKKIAAGNRTAVARDLLTYTKQYVNGPEFKKAYEAYRNDSKPRTPELKTVRTKEQVQKEEIANMDKMIKETEDMMKNMTPDVQKGMQASLDKARKTRKEYENPNHKLWNILVESDMSENKYKEDRYKKEMERFEKTLPADPRELIKSRLTKLLQTTADVDYEAELKESYGKKVFVKQEYERKPAEWKMAFRAGKDVTETTRAFAEKWLSELK